MCRHRRCTAAGSAACCPRSVPGRVVKRSESSGVGGLSERHPGMPGQLCRCHYTEFDPTGARARGMSSVAMHHPQNTRGRIGSAPQATRERCAARCAPRAACRGPLRAPPLPRRASRSGALRRSGARGLVLKAPSSAVLARHLFASERHGRSTTDECGTPPRASRAGPRRQGGELWRTQEGA